MSRAERQKESIMPASITPSSYQNLPEDDTNFEPYQATENDNPPPPMPSPYEEEEEEEPKRPARESDKERKERRRKEREQKQKQASKEAKKLRCPAPVYDQAGHSINPLNTLEMLTAICRNSDDFVPMSGVTGHWNDTRKLWHLKEKNELDAAVRGYTKSIPGLVFVPPNLMTAGSKVAGQARHDWKDRMDTPMAAPKPTQWCFRSDEGPQMFDQDTGETRPAEKSDYFTEALPYTPDISYTICPDSLKRILESAFDGDAKDIAFCTKLLAYQLFDTNRLQIIIHYIGKAGAGKGVLNRLLAKLVGAARVFKISKTKQGMGHDSHNVGLFGAKIAMLDEGHEDWTAFAVWAKEVSGGDFVKGRRMRETASYFFEYKGHVKITTNMQIPNHAIDSAFMRRYVPIRFTNAPATEKPEVEQELEKDLGRIFGYLFSIYKEQVEGKNKTEFMADMPEQSKELRVQAEQSDGFGGWASKRLAKAKTTLKRKDIVSRYLSEARELNRPGPQAEAPARKEWKDAQQKATRDAGKWLDGEGYRTAEGGKAVYAILIDLPSDETEPPSPPESEDNLSPGDRIAARLRSEEQIGAGAGAGYGYD